MANATRVLRAEPGVARMVEDSAGRRFRGLVGAVAALPHPIERPDGR